MCEGGDFNTAACDKGHKKISYEWDEKLLWECPVCLERKYIEKEIEEKDDRIVALEIDVADLERRVSDDIEPEIERRIKEVVNKRTEAAEKLIMETEKDAQRVERLAVELKRKNDDLGAIVEKKFKEKCKEIEEKEFEVKEKLKMVENREKDLALKEQEFEKRENNLTGIQKWAKGLLDEKVES